MNALHRILSEPACRSDRQAAIDKVREDGSDCALVGVSLSGCDLSGLCLIRFEMKGLDFRGCKCQDTVFPPLVDCILDGLDATGAHFTRLERCQLRNASLNGACFGARITQSDFSNSAMRHARFAQHLMDIAEYYYGNSFVGADLYGVDAAGGYFASACLRGTHLSEARLSRANLTGCDLRDADVSHANFTRAELTDAIITNAAFGGCVVTEEQEVVLRAGCPRDTNGLKTVTYAAGSATSLLEQELESTQEYNIHWVFVSVR